MVAFLYKQTAFPKMTTIIALLVSLFSYYKIRKISREVKQLKLGRDGERVVCEHLDILREKGYKIFHDIVGENINNNRGRVISLLSFISICKGEGRREVKDTITSGSTATGNSLLLYQVRLVAPRALFSALGYALKALLLDNKVMVKYL